MIRSAILAIAATALMKAAVAQTTTTAVGISTSTPTPQPTPDSPATTQRSFEIDVVFPRINTTYNFTDYIPIVFAFQNFSAAAALGSFRFIWDIMPYGRVSNPVPGGVTEDEWSIKFTSENVSQFDHADGSAYIMVNSTNTTKWVHTPFYGEPSAYALQWHILWDAFDSDTCGDAYVFDYVLFDLRPDAPNVPTAPNPGDMGNLTGSCAQFGSMHAVEGNKSGSCPTVKAMQSTNAKPCAVRLDAGAVGSISSEAATLARPTPTSSASARSSSTNVASATMIPLHLQLVVVGIFGGLQIAAL